MAGISSVASESMIARRQPSEAAIAEARLFFLLEQVLEIEAELLHGLLCRRRKRRD